MRESTPLAERLLPFLRWRHTLAEAGVRGDVVAGITVALVTLPQALAYAQLAGFPAHYGLYAAMLPAIVGALFGSCPQLFNRAGSADRHAHRGERRTPCRDRQ